MNRLAAETSPYLLQHAANPVDWWPWGEAALAAARARDKPILLSIGYSACHWCHVMAHESFEDEGTAALMNALFVNIKVDREERPDLDQIYQSAHQMLAQRGGGWPLTMFLSPDGTPFFSGTYFPREARHGLPAFVDLLERVAAAYHEQRDAISSQNESMRAALQRLLPHGEVAGAMDALPIANAVRSLLVNFDARYGGFGDAPKFPHPTDLVLLRDAAIAGDAQARHAFLFTLRRMAEGGLYDQLAGGFCRYSVDARWEIPHFEKMLYDNGLLIGLYADAWAMTGDGLYRRVASETARWIMADMQSPLGGYYSALDADSEGEEGRYYVWQRDEVAALIEDPVSRDLVFEHFGLDERPNFEAHAWHLRVARSVTDLAARHGISERDAQARIDEARACLLAHRRTRTAPLQDDKILASWNGLMIAGMAHAAGVLNELGWLDSARRAMDFVRRELWLEDRLLATWRNGRAQLNAYLDDHAYLLGAALELLQAGFRVDDLLFAGRLADALLAEFEDTQQGGFHFTRHDHEQLILRPKPAHDSAMPAGNGAAARALQRYGHLVGDSRYVDAAARTLALFYPAMEANPAGYSSLLAALDEYTAPPAIVILRGEQAKAWHAALVARAQPDALIVAPQGDSLPAALDKPMTPSAAWVCRANTCLAPISDLTCLMETLDKGRASA
ncbi:thioredoxin domain-containing protein [Uliginosibacterium sp. sgz301328]|uniref:thioredoxin domain-containing protein n=1 Tax=Uliginosibacterium sp. sgz301328 TaxID=3243764 RepID=UPI00359D5E08